MRDIVNDFKESLSSVLDLFFPEDDSLVTPEGKEILESDEKREDYESSMSKSESKEQLSCY
ncbi:hypothetical protein ACQ1Q5_04570 [Ornithobacterium rhinotracheale]